MKKTYKTPKTIVCEDAEIFCSTLPVSGDTFAGSGDDPKSHGRKDKFDDEDLW